MNKIRKAFTQSGLTQKEFAAALAKALADDYPVSDWAVIEWTKGRRNPPPIAVRIAQELARNSPNSLW